MGKRAFCNLKHRRGIIWAGGPGPGSPTGTARQADRRRSSFLPGSHRFRCPRTAGRVATCTQHVGPAHHVHRMADLRTPSTVTGRRPSRHVHRPPTAGPMPAERVRSEDRHPPMPTDATGRPHSVGEGRRASAPPCPRRLAQRPQEARERPSDGP